MNRTTHQIENFQKAVAAEGLHGKYPRGGNWITLPVLGRFGINGNPSLDMAVRKLRHGLCGNPYLEDFVTALKQEWEKQ